MNSGVVTRFRGAVLRDRASQDTLNLLLRRSVAKANLPGHQPNIASCGANRCLKRKLVERHLDRRSTKPHGEKRSKQHRGKDQARANRKEKECMQARTHPRAFCKEHTSAQDCDGCYSAR